MTTRVLAPIPDPVVPEGRRAMTRARKTRIWIARKGICWMCNFKVEMLGVGVRYDHKLPLELGGSDDDWNVYPLHTKPCDELKTRADRKRIDKMRAQQRMEAEREPSRLQSRPFDKTKRRRMNGKVVSRDPSGSDHEERRTAGTRRKTS